MIADKEEMMLTLLECMAESSEPIGTRRARAVLLAQGAELSESSVSRILRDMDARGWTSLLGTKGRHLTEAGRQHVTSVTAQRQAGEIVRRSVDVHGVQDLIDLLRARQAVESAAAADAAAVRTEERVAALTEVVARHRAALSEGRSSSSLGLSFHRMIASMSPNKMLATMTDLLLAPALDHVEAVLDVVLGQQQHEAAAPDQHEVILQAIRDGDPVAAERAMYEHLGEMTNEVRSFLHGANEPMFERLLAWASANPTMVRDA